MLFLAHRVEGILHLFGRARCLGFERDPGDLPILDDEGLARRHPDNWEHRDMEGLGHLSIRVGDKREGELLIVAEFFLRLRRIAAHPEDLKTIAAQARVGIPEGTGLLGATGSRRLRVEVNERDSLPVDLGKGDLLAILILGGEERCRSTHGERLGMGEEGKEVHGGNQEKGLFHTPDQ